MKKNRNSNSALFNPRAIFALFLCLVGISIAMLSFAAPNSPQTTTATTPTEFKPVVIQSLYNGASFAVRDLPLFVASESAAAETEHELPPVKPTQPIPVGFVDPAAQTVAAALNMPSPLVTFEGQSSVDSAGSAAGCLCTPPDTNGAVGPTQYVQTVNQVVSVYDKSGTRLSGPTKINSLFQTLPADSRCRIDNDGDPVVVYDQLADRWVLTQFAVGGGSGPTSSECIAISKTPDATGEYYIYDFPLGAIFEDYPHFGLWPDAYYMSTHEFSFASGNAFLGSAAWAFERAKMLVGQPAQMVKFKLGSTANTFFGGHLPSNLDGFTLPPAGSPNYFAEVDAAGDGTRPDGKPAVATLDIWKFHVDWSNPLLSTFGDNGNPSSTTPVADFARPGCSATVVGAGCVPQLGDAGALDAIGDRLMYRNAYRNFGDHESLVLNHSVVAAATGGQTTQIGPRWYEVRNPGGTPTIFQQSTFGPINMTDLLYRWMGSIAMDRAGDIAIGYSTSSAASFPSIAYAGRLATDPANTLAQGEAQMFVGTGPQRNEFLIPFAPTGFGRWGDYTDMTVDPVDDCTFWYTNEYYSSTDAPDGIWHTRVGSFKFPQCTARQTGYLRGTVTESNTGAPIAGAGVTAGSYTVYTDSNGFYQFSPLAPGSYTVSAFEMGYFPNSASSVAVTDGGVTTQDFALVRNQAEPTPTPGPSIVLQTVNPPVLNDPGSTITVNNYAVSWSPAEVTTGLTGYVVEESTDYVNPLFDNADGTNPPGQAGSLWTSGGANDPWVQDPAYHISLPFSYAVSGEDSGFTLAIDTSLTLNNNITVAGSVGSARLSFFSRYFNDPDDTGNIEISTNGGSAWTSLRILKTTTPLPPSTDTRMQSYEIDLTAYKGTPIKLRFRYNTARSLYPAVPSTGWSVDDINVDGGTWTQIATTGPGTTSVNLTNKPGGHYYYRVRGVYTNGNATTNSNVQDIIVNLPLQLASAASMKSHGTAGPFEVNLPLAGTRGVECRSAGALPSGANGDYQMVFTFSNNLSSVTNASVTSHDPANGTGTVTSTSMGPKANQYTVNLSNVSNAQYITVSLNGVSDGLGHTLNVVGPQMGVLAGDVTGNGFVTNTDVGSVKAQVNPTTPVTQTNCRQDVSGNGFVTNTDVGATKAQVNPLSGLPSTP